MLNLIKMDLYRITKARSVKIGLILSAIISFAAVGLSAAFMAILKIGVEADPSLSQNMSEVELVFPFLAWDRGVDLGTIIIHFTSALSLAISIILSAIFVNEEQSSGYGKNYLGQLSEKGKSAISKIIATSVICITVLLVYTVVSVGAGYLFFGKSINCFSVGRTALVMLLRLLMYLSINTMVVFFALFTKSKSSALVVGVMFGMGVTKMAYTMITSVIQMIVSKVFSSSNFIVPDFNGIFPDGVEAMISSNRFFQNPDGDIIIRAIVVAAVFIIGFSVISFMSVRKRDVR